ncbi:GntR family transcriptional regulator [Selenomonas sp. TAMA-11512]|uniref:GntR family transcriptional regulator n=1 Tax=Selenomonas sp. TAMA-11512 TaxID=3095337 RepID=UPI003085384D|nr:GntR family transcriptional regulator [Selenomonas sp. TAMA-11512]
MCLNESSAEPLYQQLKDKLKRKIEAGEWQKGDKIPTELDLSQTYQVSRITVRKALDTLVREGYIVRRSGKGTFINSDKIQRPITGATSFTDICHAMGLEPGAKTIKSVIEPPDDMDKQILGLNASDRIISIERVRTADNVPVSVEISHFKEEFSFLLNEDLTNKSMYDLIRTKYQIAFDCSRKTIEIVFATYELSKYLNVSRGYPLLLICSDLVSLETNTNICFNRQYILGDRFRLMI